MNKIEIALSSPAFWSLVGVFFVEGLKAVLPSLNGTLALVVQLVLAGLSAVLQTKEIQIAGRTGMLGSKKI